MISWIVAFDTIALTSTVSAMSDSAAATSWRWLAPLAALMDWLLGLIYAVVASHGLSIIVLAVLLRVVMLPISLSGARYQKRSQQKRTELAPLLVELQKKWANDHKREYAETMALYREHGLNPMAQFKGCLPLLIQLPLLLALYQLLTTSPELAGQEFLWIDDLSRPDALFGLGFAMPYLGDTFNLLPFIMLLAQLDIARSMAVSKKPGARSGSNLFAYLMPLVMLVLFYPFPAGCMLYWAVGNVGQAVEHRVFLRGKP